MIESVCCCLSFCTSVRVSDPSIVSTSGAFVVVSVVLERLVDGLPMASIRFIAGVFFVDVGVVLSSADGMEASKLVLSRSEIGVCWGVFCEDCWLCGGVCCCGAPPC